MFCQNPNLVWAKQIGGVGSNGSGGNSIKVDFLGNACFTGTFQGTNDFDPGPGTYTLNSFGSADIFISKLDPLGNFLWAKQIMGNNDDISTFLFVDGSGNIYVTGYFNSTTVDFDPGPGTFTLSSISSYSFANAVNGFVLKLDPNGNFIWVKQLGDAGAENAYCINVDNAGSIYTVGNFYGVSDLDPSPGTYTLSGTGYSDVFISKLDAFGNFVWAKQIASNNGIYSSTIVSDASGAMYLTGAFIGTADFDPGPGTYTLASATIGAYDIFVLKLNSVGNFQFAKQMSGGWWTWGTSMVTDVSKNIYLTGYFDYTVDFDPSTSAYNLTSFGSTDAYVTKLDSIGNFIWTSQLGGPGQDQSNSIYVDPSGNVYTTGYFRGTADFDPSLSTYTFSSPGHNNDIFISKLDNSGNFMWAKQIGDTSADVAASITLDLNDNIYTTGFFRLSPDFDINIGTYSMTTIGNTDAFIHKMCQVSCPTGVKEVDSFESAFMIYPNPASNNLFISKEDEFSVSPVIEILNYLGQTVLKSDLKNKIDVSSLSNGVYILKLISEGQTVQKRFVIDK